jgi:hypothetical protein
MLDGNLYQGHGKKSQIWWGRQDSRLSLLCLLLHSPPGPFNLHQQLKVLAYTTHFITNICANRVARQPEQNTGKCAGHGSTTLQGKCVCVCGGRINGRSFCGLSIAKNPITCIHVANEGLVIRIKQ